MRTSVFSKSAEGLVAVAVGAVVCAAFVPALASAAPTGAVHTLPTGSVDGGSSGSSDGVRTATVDDEGEQLSSSCEDLEQLEDLWSDQVGSSVDQATVVCASGGGNAYYSKFELDHSYAQVGAESDGNFSRVLRHELGHNFYADDYHGGGAEGSTIMNGNDLSRFDGTEFAAIVDAAEVASARLDDVGRYTASPIPPYAALDTARVRSGGTVTVDAVANDHDSNGDSIKVTGVGATSLLGGTVKLENGEVVFEAGTKAGTDRILYTLTDAAGGTSTGWIIVDVSA